MKNEAAAARSVSPLSPGNRLDALRVKLLRGGRLVKLKGVLASIAPSLAGVGLAVGLMVAEPALAADVAVNGAPPTTVTGDVSVTNTGTLTNGTDTTHAPVDVENVTGNANVTIGVHNVNVTAGSNAGIFVNTAGTGDVTVTSDGDVTGTAKGINITDTGSGNVSVTSTGSITGTNDSGVRVVGSSQPGYGVTVNVNSVTANAGGSGAAIDVNNTSAGGATTIKATGTLTNTAGHVIRINGVDGVPAGQVGGPLTIDVGALCSGSAPSGSTHTRACGEPTSPQAGGFRQSGGDGIQLVGAVGSTGAMQPTSITTGDIDVAGTGVNLAQSINRVDGPTTVNTGNITAGGEGVAIESNDNADQYLISVKAGTLTTGGTGLDVNQSGTGGITVVTGDINAGTATTGGINGFQSAGGYGVRLDSDPHGTTAAGQSDFNLTTGNVTVTDTSGVFAGTGIALGTINSGGNGNTTVTAGNISAGTGVIYNRAGTGSVNLTTGNITASTGNGIQYGTNIVQNDLVIKTGDINAAGDGITGDTSTGIGVTTLDVGNITAGSDGINVIHSGTGAATITSTGTINAVGIGVSLTNDSGTFSAVPTSKTTINVNNITTPNNTAVYLNSYAYMGSTVNVNGAIATPAADVIAGDGMRLYESLGPLNVNIAKDASITSYNNTMELTNSDTMGTTVNVDGKLISTVNLGADDGVIWVWGTPGTTAVNINDGSTVQAADPTGFAMTDNGGNSVVTVGNAAVTGGFRLGAGNDALTFNGTDMTNVGTLDGGGGSTGGGDVLSLNDITHFTRNLQTAGQGIQNWDSVNLNGGAADLVGTMTTGQFTLGKDASNNPAALTIGAGHAGDALTVTGNYVGAGGGITLDTDASTHTADTLNVGGSVSGVTALSLNDVTPTGAASDLMDINVVNVTGASSPGNAFVLASGPAVMGGRAYLLQQGDSAYNVDNTVDPTTASNWYLNLQACPPGGLNATNGATLGCVTDDTLTLDGNTTVAGNFQGGGGMDKLSVLGGASVGGIVAGGDPGADASQSQDSGDQIIVNTTGSVGGVQGNLGDDLIYVVGSSTVNGNVEGNQGNNQIRIGGMDALVDGSIPTTDAVTVNGDVLGGDSLSTDGNNQIWVLGGSHVTGNVVGGNGNDMIVLNGATAKVDGAVDGGAGDNTIALLAGTAGSVKAGDGNNTIGLNGGSAGSVAVGNGNNSITLAGATIGGGITAGNGVNTIDLDSGSAASVTAGDGGNLVNLAGAAIVGAVTTGSGADTINLISGTAGGGINAGAGADTVNVAGSTFTLGATKLDGGAAGEGNTLNLNAVNQTLTAPQNNLVNWDTINIKNSTVTVNGGDSLSAAAVNLMQSTLIAHSGFNINGNLTLDPSTIDMQDGVAGSTFTVSGNYAAVGSGNTLKVDADFTNNVADKLSVGGKVTGVTQLDVNNVTVDKAKSTGKDVVVAQSTSATPDSISAQNFSLAGGSITSGIYNYSLTNGVTLNTVVLRGHINALGAAYSASMGALADTFGALPTLEQRVGQREWLAKGNGGAFEGAWVRFNGDRSTTTPAASTVDFSTLNDSWGAQVGVDFRLWKSPDGRLTAGVTGQYKGMNADVNTATGQGGIRAQGGGGGVNLTWYGVRGEYADLQAQYNKVSATISASQAGTAVDGLGADSKSASLEVGKRFVVSADGKSVLVPQVQVSWGLLSTDPFSDSQHQSVDLGTDETALARVGLAYEFHPDGVDLVNPDKDGKMFYAIANVLQNLAPSNSVMAYGTQLDTRNLRTWGELGLGGSLAVSNNMLVYGEVDYRQSFQYLSNARNNGVGGTVGVRIAW